MYPLYNYQNREKFIRQQLQQRNSRKSTINNQPPPSVPRLEIYKKRVAKERLARLKAETEAKRQIKIQGERRAKQKKCYKTEIKTETLDDQLREISAELGIPMVVFQPSNYQDSVFYEYEAQLRRKQRMAQRRRTQSVCTYSPPIRTKCQPKSSYLAEETRFERDGMLVYDDGLSSTFK